VSWIEFPFVEVPRMVGLFLFIIALGWLAAGPVYIQLTRRKNALLMRMLEQITDWLDSHDIEYWLDWGTLLGAVREGRLLRHDTDVDLAVPAGRAAHLRQAVAQEQLADRYFVKDRGTSILFGLRRHPFLHAIEDEVLVHVEFVEEDTQAGELVNSGGKRRVPLAFVRPLGSIRLGNRAHPTPGERENYLRALYGYWGRRCIYEGNDRYRACASIRDYLIYWSQQLIFYRLYFSWKSLPLPRIWKAWLDHWSARLSRKLSFPEPKL
jgi:LicD family protein